MKLQERCFLCFSHCEVADKQQEIGNGFRIQRFSILHDERGFKFTQISMTACELIPHTLFMSFEINFA